MHIEILARAGKELGNSSFIGGKIERKLNFFEIAEYVLKGELHLSNSFECTTLICVKFYNAHWDN